jgi:hypothetical protein
MVARAAELATQPGHYATDQSNNPYIIPDHRDRLGAKPGSRRTAASQRSATAWEPSASGPARSS